VPLVIGLLVGFIAKHTIKIVFAIALVVLPVSAGCVRITYQDILDHAMKLLPRIISTGRGLIDVLPYSTTTFIIG
jgi:uncharacterized membrane protein (Fun14 family)